MDFLENPKKIHWYQKTWGVISMVLIGVFFLILISFLILAIRYWWQIKHGLGAGLEKKFYGSFSQSFNSVSGNVKINRRDLETDDDPFLGNPNAQIVIVEFVDFQCPNCKASASVLKELVKNYGYKIKYIIRDFPIDSTHSNASKLSQIAYCSARQGKFWQMHDVLFSQQDNLSANLDETKLKKIADLASVDYTKLSSCFNSDEAKTEVNKDYSDAVKFGARGTPTFFINGQKLEGVVPFNDWEKIIQNF